MPRSHRFALLIKAQRRNDWDSDILAICLCALAISAVRTFVPEQKPIRVCIVQGKEEAQCPKDRTQGDVGYQMSPFLRLAFPLPT